MADAGSSVKPVALGDLRLVHYSIHVVHRVRSKRQTNVLGFKPEGFWVSVENFEPNWKTWCEAEQYDIGNLKVPYDVRLREDAEILWLRTAEDIDKFTADYDARKGASIRICNIDWKRLAENHRGIIIAPYQWSRRFSTKYSWYYAWDCASGCIWDARAIESTAERKAAMQDGSP